MEKENELTYITTMHHIQFFSHHLSCLIQEEGLATQNQEKRELCTGSRKASVLTGALLLSREKIYAKKCFYYLYVNVIFNCRQHIIQHSSGWLWSAISAPIILESSENYVSGQFPKKKLNSETCGSLLENFLWTG